MITELMVESMVKTWSARTAPGDDHAASCATDVAMRCLAGGASAAEAVQEGRRFVECWARHPARWVPAPQTSRPRPPNHHALAS
jgi:hypothetical protein